MEKLYVAASQQQVKKSQKLATLWIPDWTAAQPLFELTSLQQVWIVIDYPPSAANQIKTGSKVTASADSQPGELFHGTATGRGRRQPHLESPRGDGQFAA